MLGNTRARDSGQKYFRTIRSARDIRESHRAELGFGSLSRLPAMLSRRAAHLTAPERSALRDRAPVRAGRPLPADRPSRSSAPRVAGGGQLPRCAHAAPGLVRCRHTPATSRHRPALPTTLRACPPHAPAGAGASDAEPSGRRRPGRCRQPVGRTVRRRCGRRRRRPVQASRAAPPARVAATVASVPSPPTGRTRCAGRLRLSSVVSSAPRYHPVGRGRQ